MGKLSRVLLLAVVLAGALAATAAATADHSDWPYVPIHDHTRYKRNDPPGIDKWVATGTDRSDELLGGHHDDRLYGLGGSDILWGDYLAAGNTAVNSVTSPGISESAAIAHMKSGGFSMCTSPSM